MGRQTKLSESFSEKKSAVKLPVKRKLLPADDENIAEICTVATPVSLVEEDTFQMAKKALHTARPSTLLAREGQFEEVYHWLDLSLKQKIPGGMYISGAPGTGKTAVVLHAIRTWEQNHPSKSHSFHNLMVNCMSIRTPTRIYDEIMSIWKNDKKSKDVPIKERIHKKLLSSSKAAQMIVLVLDEIDQLLQGSGIEILYSLFEWAKIPGSKLILIGIANALDLTARHLPLLESMNIAQGSPSTSNVESNKSRGAQPKSKTTAVKVINFPPYERSDIENILVSRLIEIGSEIFDPAAIKFVAAKVAASTGDMRKALNACKLALDAVEKQQRLALKSTADDGFNFSSPKKCCVIREKIGVGILAKVFAPQKDEGPLPLQQMIILATLMKLYKDAPGSRQPKWNGIISPVPLTIVYDEYRNICAAKGFSWIDRSEIISIGHLLQDRSLVTVVENMPGGSAKTKKFGTMNSNNKTGFLFNITAVEKIVMQCDMKSIISE